MDPPNLKIAFEWAEKIEEKDWVKVHFGRQKEYDRGGPHYPTYQKQSPKLYPTYPDITQNPHPSQKFTQTLYSTPSKPNHSTTKIYPEAHGKTLPLSEKDMQDRRARGLCFKCDERWAFNDVCKNRELQIILTEEIGDEEEVFQEVSDELLPDIEDPMAGITLHSLVGFTKPKTMKLEGIMAREKVIILIDSGATNNLFPPLQLEN